jgi:predicted NBD/HSP70 family sugar kinase
MALELLKKEKKSALSKIPQEQLNIEAIIEAASAGDRLAVGLIDRAADHVGIGIDIMIKLFNPEAITLSGELVENGDYFLKKVKEKVSSIALPIYQPKIPILTSSFGEEASLMGAISLILQMILRME